MPGNTGGSRRYLPLKDYAVIGDCHTAALVARDGSIDWYCPERFDGPAVFCRLLDDNKGGYLRVAPDAPCSVERRYRDRTNVLETLHRGDGFQIRITDFMPIHRRTPTRAGHDVGASYQLVRLVEGIRGEVDVNLSFKPTFDYARARTEVELHPDGAVAQAGGKYLVLSCPGAELEAAGDGFRGRLRLEEGDRRWIALTSTDDLGPAQDALAPASYEKQLALTLDYWEQWSDACTYKGPYRNQVVRSALTLKLLTYEPTGAIVAAPTCSLPEEPGGVRNWDYRYTWLRDSTLILYSLVTVGYQEEARDFLRWLGSTCGDDPTMLPQIMYGIDGRRDLTETRLEHLEGYRGSRPVRIGNAAASQRQLDIFGEALAAAEILCQRGEPGSDAGAEEDRDVLLDTWPALSSLVEQAAQRWREPDRGIWEVRGGPQDFLYSKLMCWAAVDRGVRLARENHLDAPLDRWSRTRDVIRLAILNKGYDPQCEAFTQAFGSSVLDASALTIPRVGFLPPTDRRVSSTIRHIRDKLTHDGLVYRYLAPDGLAGGEGTFTLCSFWLVDALALSGDLDGAHELFEGVLGYANDVGLLSEEINPTTGELLGNFPQGFTHLGLISSAVNLAKAAKHGPEDSPETEGRRAGRARQAATEGRSARREYTGKQG